MSEQQRIALFDDWAEQYDQSIQDDGTFPFDGYEKVLEAIVRAAGAQPGMKVLDLGTGTGNLAARFVEPGCAIWAIDFSAKMLAKARARLPQAVLVQTGLLDEWPPELDHRFDRIVSAYVLHELELPRKIQLLQRLTECYLADGGRIVIGDVAYLTSGARELAHIEWADRWDEEEYYWAADEALPACASVGLRGTYTQVSGCGGVLIVEPPPSAQPAMP